MSCWISFRKHKYKFTLSIIFQHWDGAGSWNPSSWKTKTSVSCIVNTTVADVLATQGLVLTYNVIILDYFSFSKRKVSTLRPEMAHILQMTFSNAFLKSLISNILYKIGSLEANWWQYLSALFQVMAWHKTGNKLFSYMINCEYRVGRNQYSQLLFTGEDQLCANLRVQEQSTNMTLQCQ